VDDSLPSSAERRYTRYKRQLTLDLFLREGRLWEAVSTVRERWSVDVQRRVPDDAAPLRPAILDVDVEPSGRFNQLVLRMRWSDEVKAVHDTVIPSAFRNHTSKRLSQMKWFSFLAYCVLYDPPAMELLEFASRGEFVTVGFGNVDPKTIDTETWTVTPPPEDGPTMSDPPIAMVAAPDDLRDAERSLWMDVIAELGRRYFEPESLDVFEIVAAILRETGLVDVARRRYASVQLQPHITVDPATTKDDVLAAFRIIAATQPERIAGGRPAVDPLVAVQCVIFKRRGWSNADIATHFGWPLRADAYGVLRRSNTANEHLKAGGAILGRREYPTE
jgi:hypothetical protein